MSACESARKGFTLVEVMVSTVILVLLLLILVSITDATRRTWTYTSGKIEQFHDAREGFESITRKLSQATLNTYWDYHYPNGTSNPPDRYIRQSELRFISGNAVTLTGASTCPAHAVFFQAPMGYVSDTTDYSSMKTLLNTWGYYVQFASDKAAWPNFIQGMANQPAQRYRFRLMELSQPSESLTLYTYTSGTTSTGASKNASYTTTEWFTTPLTSASPPVRVVAENIVALVLLPKLTPSDETTGGYNDGSLAPNYLYDSTGTGMSTVSDPNLDPINQLPPVVQVTMVAVDESTYNRFQASGTTMPTSLLSGTGGTLFQTVGDTTNSANAGYAQDLQKLQTNLQNNKINYRVFTSSVSLKAAKWSRKETN